MIDVAFGSATYLLANMKAGLISSSEVLETCIGRYQRHNPAINAIVATSFDHARRRAQQADEARARGQIWGPLHGLPMTIKESIEVAGMRCSSGSPSLASHVSVASANVTEALLGAGAIIFGKTNIPKFTQDMQSYNEVYGQTNNPWNLACVPGGSSGGSAAALAAGLSPVELGSDLGGSVRIPAHCCGVFSHKPSFGLVSTHGHVPPMPGMFSGAYADDGDLGVIGPLARSADDLDLLLDIIAAPKVPDQIAYRLQLPSPRRERLQDFRIGIWFSDAMSPVDTQVSDVLSRFTDLLARAGARISEEHPDFGFPTSHRLFTQLLNAHASSGLPDAMYAAAQTRLARLDPADQSYPAQWVRGTTLSHREWIRLHHERLLLRQRWADYFGKFDLLLCPVLPVTAFAHDHGEMFGRTLDINGKACGYLDSLLSWNGLATVAYLPATVMPAGLAGNGMPVGVQIISPYLEDRTGIHFAKLASKLTGPWQPPPGYAT